MRLTVINGSPRGATGNTEIFLRAFTEGFLSVRGNTADSHALAKSGGLPSAQHAVGESDCLLIGFPLYADAMPSLTKSFIESLEPYCGKLPDTRVVFLVQCGFPEAMHLRTVERYLEKLAKRLGIRHVGTIIRAGAEGTRYEAASKREKVVGMFRRLGEGFAKEGALDASLVKKLAGMERFTGVARLILQGIVLFGVVDRDWDKSLKANRAYEARFDAPYGRQA